jgi:hypothetical protein
MKRLEIIYKTLGAIKLMPTGELKYVYVVQCMGRDCFSCIAPTDRRSQTILINITCNVRPR